MLERRSSEYELIYLDIEFIADLYDTTGDLGVPTTISKTQGSGGGVNIGFVNAGIQATETRQYKLTTRAMYRDLQHQLEQYPALEQRPADNSQLFWLDGRLEARTIRSTSRRGNEITGQEIGKYFSLKGSSVSFVLLASSSYFSYNYASILDQFSSIRSEFALEVRCLIKPISETKQDLKAIGINFIGSPLVMLEKPTGFSRLESS